MKINIANNEIIHFIGIGGIGMSGLAQIMTNMGFQIQGSDLNGNKNTDRLVKAGIKIYIGHNPKNIRKATRIVISSAIKKNNIELPMTVLSSEHAFYAPSVRNKIFIVSYVMNPELYGASKTEFGTEETSEYHRANINRYPDKKKFMKKDAIEIDTIELDEGEKIPNLDPYDAMIVMGGPMDTWQEELHPWLVPEKESIYEFACIQKKPYLGLCLGAQLLGEVVGGKVNKMNKPEIGVLDINISNHDSLFKGMNNNVKVLQWHSYEVSDLPDSTTLLASSDVCQVQAFSFERAYGLQFHVEQTNETVPQWSCVPEYKTALEETLGPNALDKFTSGVDDNLDTFNNSAKIIYHNFISII